MLVAFSCKVRGLCNSCDGKRMIEEAEHLCNSVLPHVPYRQWVLTLPFDLRYLAAWNVSLRNAILTAAMNAIHRHYEAQARARGIKGKVQSGAVVVTQRFSSDLRLNLHFHILVADGVWAERDGQVEFRPGDHRARGVGHPAGLQPCAARNGPARRGGQGFAKSNQLYRCPAPDLR